MRASTALAAYAEPMLAGRRVVVLGDASSGLSEELLNRGARLIHVYDPDPGRVAEAAARNTSRNVTFAALSDDAFAVREGAFEFGVVENLAELPSPERVLGRLKRALSPRAPLLVATPNPDVRRRLLPTRAPASALSYYEFYDLVSAEFEQVHLLGQTPFVGYAVAAFAPQEEPSPTLDTSLVPGGAEEPEWFVALASQRALRFEEYSVVQIPFAAVEAAPAAPVAPLRQRARRDAAPSHPDQSAALEEAKRQLRERDQWIEQLEARSTAADARADELQTELETTAARLREAETRLAKTNALTATLQGKVDAAHSDAKRSRIEQEARQERCNELQAEADKLRQEQARAQRLLEERSQQLQVLSDIEAQAGRDIASLEGQLRERGEEVRRLQGELREVERVSKELVDELQTPTAPDARTADIAAKLDALAALNAQREADLAAAQLHIQKLESDLGETGEEPLSERCQDLQRQLDEARGQLQRQAVLIEQARSGQGPASPDGP